MPDRIPPKIDVPVDVTLPGGAATPTTVKAVPTAPGGAEPGEVLIDGKPSADLTASGTGTVRGTAQTFSRFVNQLSLVAVQGGKEIPGAHRSRWRPSRWASTPRRTATPAGAARCAG